MKVADFSFSLPEELIAQEPPAERGQSRLMVLDRAAGTRLHRRVTDLPGLLEPGALLVFNNSRVRKARLRGRSLKSGGEVEFLLVKALDGRTWEFLSRRSSRRRPGDRFVFAEGSAGEIEAEIVEGGASPLAPNPPGSPLSPHAGPGIGRESGLPCLRNAPAGGSWTPRTPH